MNQKLQLYSLPMGPGASVGNGPLNLLGSTSESPLDLLVRECAQNSWDARLDGKRPHFSLSTRKLSDQVMSNLQHRALPGFQTTRSQELREFFEDSSRHWAIEISDRNTTGLSGLTDSTIVSEDKNASTNFRDLIFTYGTTSDVEYSGGSYGYGKSATFSLSRSHAVIYWTRCFHDGQLEYRLIATHVGKEFTSGNKSFTGRHWWGVKPDSDSILPLVGEVARELGELIFEHHFSGAETGTNILVIDPRTDAKDASDSHSEPVSVEEQMRSATYAMRDTVLLNLWPKLTGYNRAPSPMSIEVKFNGENLRLGDPNVGLWKVWSLALNSVRALEQSDAQTDLRCTTEAIKYKNQSPDQPPGFRDIGTLGLAYDVPLAVDEPFDQLFKDKGMQICNMRSTELVVSYEELTFPPRNLRYDCGVFKVQENKTADDAFKNSENPTHTEWKTGRVEHSQRLILQKAKSDITRFCGSHYADPEDTPGVNSASPNISNSLRSLVPEDSPEEVTRYSPGARRGRRKKLKIPAIVGETFAGITPSGNQIHTLSIETPEKDGSFPVKLSVNKEGEGHSYSIPPSELSFSWRTTSSGALSAISLRPNAHLKASNTYRVDISAPVQYQLSFELSEDR